MNQIARSLELINLLAEELRMKLNQHQGNQAVSEENMYEIKPNLRAIKILTQIDWTIFKNRSRESFPGFLEQLWASSQNLPPPRPAFFLVIKLNFDNQEIAEALGISPRSALRSRHRLKIKLGLEKTEDLEMFVENFSQ